MTRAGPLLVWGYQGQHGTQVGYPDSAFPDPGDTNPGYPDAGLSCRPGRLGLP